MDEEVWKILEQEVATLPKETLEKLKEGQLIAKKTIQYVKPLSKEDRIFETRMHDLMTVTEQLHILEETISNSSTTTHEEIEEFGRTLFKTIPIGILTEEIYEIVQSVIEKGLPEVLLQIEKKYKKSPRRTKKNQQYKDHPIVNETSKILQNSLTNRLSKMKSKPNEIHSNINHTSKKTTITSDEMTLTMVLEKIAYIPSNVRSTTWMLLDAIVIDITAKDRKSLKAEIPLATYMNARGLNSEKDARKQILEDLAILNSIEINDASKSNRLKVQLSGGTSGIYKSVITFNINEDFRGILNECSIMVYPNELFKLRENKNPYSYALGRRIAEHKNMNLGKTNENIISVKTLLESLRGMPTYEEVMESDRHLFKRIIDPFERDMHALRNILTWNYCNAKGVPLTDNQRETFDYHQFGNAMIFFQMNQYPNPTQKIALKRQVKKKK